MATKKCKYCKQEIDKAATVCPYCQRKQSSGCLTAAVCVTAVLLGIGIIGSCTAKTKKQPVQQPDSAPAATEQNTPEQKAQTEAQTEPELIHYEAELPDGFYTVGIDIPAGKYDIYALSGSGNVSSSNMFDGGINAMMGDESSNSLFEREYHNITLPDGEILHVRGALTVKIESDKASPEPLKPRNQSITETITLTNGYYTAGEDFPAGVYTLRAVEGGGNIFSEGSEETWLINEILGTEEYVKKYSAIYAQEYRNVKLSEGMCLKIDGLTIEMEPSK